MCMSDDVYNIFKETWIGETVKSMCNMGDILRRKNVDEESKLFGLLAIK